MAENKGPDFATLLSAVKKAQTDNEKFASLLLVTKFTNAETLSAQNRKELFDAIGSDFLLRLLQTCSTDSSANTAAFASIGATVLCAFGSDESIATGPQMSDVIPALLGAVDVLQKNGLETKSAIEDCAECLKVLAARDVNATKIIEANGLGILCKLYGITKKASNELLVLLLASHGEIWTDESKVLEGYLEKLSSDFKVDQGLDKFDLCKYLFGIISTIPATYTPSSDSWRKNAMDGLREILSSNVLPEQRNVAFGLASEVLRVVGNAKFFTDKTESNFPLVIVRLACIDAGMLMKKLESENTIDPGSIGLMISCYSIIEAACSVIAEFDEGEEEEDVLSFEQIQIVQPAMAEVIELITKFLVNHLSSSEAMAESELCIEPSIRVLGSWLNVEYNLTSNLGRESFQLIPKCLEYIMKSDTIGIIKSVLPAVIKATETENLNKDVINEVFPLAGDVTEYALQNASQDMEAFHMTLQTFLGILLIVRKEDVTKHRRTVKELFSVVMNAVQKSTGLETDGHLATLSVVIMNLPKLTPPAEETTHNQTREAISSAITFVKSCFHVSEDGTKLEVSEAVKEQGEDFASLWIICGRELARLATRQEWVRRMLKEEHWTKEQLPVLFNLAKSAGDVEVAETFSCMMKAIGNGQRK